MFIDSARIFVKAGNGGNGAVSFRREKYIAAGGPDGGDGGKGGDVVFYVDEGATTLQDFRYRRHYKAEAGEPGSGSNRTGRSGKDMLVKVPPGTIVKDEETGRIIADLTENGQTAVISSGGRGGKGNSHFATPTRQVPNFSQSGEPGEERWVLIELKVLADVGLIGYPNVGKSTILSMVSAATPKIADYHFTTLKPNLGVVSLDVGNSFVLADIPGLIEGAHEGVGLGHEFLKHVERTRLLVHVVDISASEGRDPVEDFENINRELGKYSELLSQKPQVIAANKMDITGADENLETFMESIKPLGYDVFPISAATGEGLRKLMFHVGDMLKKLPETKLIDVTADEGIVYTAEKEKPFGVRKEGEIYVVEGDWVTRILRSVNLSDHESLKYFQREMKRRGIIDALEDMGINEGDAVRIGELEFEYIK